MYKNEHRRELTLPVTILKIDTPRAHMSASKEYSLPPCCSGDMKYGVPQVSFVMNTGSIDGFKNAPESHDPSTSKLMKAGTGSCFCRHPVGSLNAMAEP
jgi:hypothetical protein